MRYGRALLAGLGWAGTLGGLSLCVLIVLSAYVAFDGHGDGVKPRDEDVVRLRPVPDDEVPRVPLGRPARRAGGGDGGGGGAARGGAPGSPAPRAGATPPATSPVGPPRAPAGGSPRPAAPAPAARPPAAPGDPQPPGQPTLGDTTRGVAGAVGTEVGQVSPPVGRVIVDTGDTLGDAVDALTPPPAPR